MDDRSCVTSVSGDILARLRVEIDEVVALIVRPAAPPPVPVLVKAAAPSEPPRDARMIEFDAGL